MLPAETNGTSKMQITIDIAPELSPSQRCSWLAFWESSRNSHPRQHPVFGGVAPSAAHKVLYVSVYRNGVLVCVGQFWLRPTPLLAGGSIEAVCQRGPIVDDPSVLRDVLPRLVGMFRAQKVGRLRIAPHWLDANATSVERVIESLGWRAVRNRRVATGVIDLRPAEADILRSFSEKTRYQIRLAQRRGVIVTPAQSEAEVGAFWSILTSMQAARRLHGMGHYEFRAMAKSVLLNQELGVLLLAKYDDTIVSGMSVLRDSVTAYPSRYALASRMPIPLATVRVGAILWWAAMRWARSCGCISFDVEGYDQNTPESSEVYQIHAFKEGFRPRSVAVLGDFTTRCHPGVFVLSNIQAICGRVVRASRRMAYRVIQRVRTRSISPARAVRPSDGRPQEADSSLQSDKQSQE